MAEDERFTRSRRRRALAAAAGIVLAAACGGEPHPNVLLYVSDTLRADGLGCYGNEVVETPNVDRFAAEGVVFERAVSPSSWTRASMASILSGTSPQVHGAEGRDDLLDDSVVLLSELLRDAGYATANVVTNPNVGSTFGFSQGYAPGDFRELYEETGTDMVRVEELVTLCDEATRVALEWVATAPEPFFLLVHTIDPHSPYTPPAEWDRYGAGIPSDADGTQRSLFQLSKRRSAADVARTRSLYYGEIAFNDDAFGTLVEGLRRRGVLERTIAVFTSDHGEEFWERGERGHGKTLNEKALHVPLILRYPAALDAARREDRLVSTVDLLPTVLALADLPVPDWIEGRSILADGPGDGLVFASTKLQRRDLLSVRDERRKLVWDRATGRRGLWDVSRGAEGERELSAREPAVADALFRALEAHVEHERARRLALHGSERAPRAEVDDETNARLDALGYAEEGADGEPDPDDPSE